MKTENEIMAELLESVYHTGNTQPKGRRVANGSFLNGLSESIFSGNADEKDDEDKDSDDEEKDEEKDTSDDDESTEKDESSDEESEEEESEESEEESDDDDDDSDSDSPFGKKKGESKTGPFTSKIRSLQKEYNDLLVDAFEKYAPECIEDALDEAESAFGENIEELLDSALGKLKDKILDDLGVEGSDEDEIPPMAMGGFDPVAGEGAPMEITI